MVSGHSRSQGMSRLTAFSVLVLSICAAALALPAMAEACSCAGPGEDDNVDAFYANAIKQSDGAVIARVMKVRKDENGSGSSIDDERVYTLRIRRAFKHLKRFEAGSTIRIRTSTQSSACGLGLKRGAVAGFLLYRDEGQLRGGLCGLISPKTMRRAGAYLESGEPLPQMASAGCSGASTTAA